MDTGKIRSSLGKIRHLKLCLVGGLTVLDDGCWDITKVWERMSEAWPIKIVLAGIVTALFGDITAGMKAVFVLVTVDFITKLCALSKDAGGFCTAWKTDVINSKGMKQLVPKAFWYMSLITVSYQLEQFTFLGQILGFTPVELTCSYLGLIEAKSILENLRDTGMKGLEPFIGILGDKQEQLLRKKD